MPLEIIYDSMSQIEFETQIEKWQRDYNIISVMPHSNFIHLQATTHRCDKVTHTHTHTHNTNSYFFCVCLDIFLGTFENNNSKLNKTMIDTM